MASSYTAKTSERIGRQLEAAAAVRPRNFTIVLGLCAGVLAGIGAIAAGPLGAGVGGGLGAGVGFVVANAMARGMEPPLAGQMVAALDSNGLELRSVAMLSGRPTESLLLLPYDAIASVETEEKLLTIRADVRTTEGATIELESGRIGVGAGPELFAALRGRVA